MRVCSNGRRMVQTGTTVDANWPWSSSVTHVTHKERRSAFCILHSLRWRWLALPEAAGAEV
jgi:hypothetical protein